MHFSAVEIGIRRQLSKCEAFIKVGKNDSDEHTILDIIKNIESSIVILKKSPNKPPDEVIQTFYVRIKAIKENIPEYDDHKSKYPESNNYSLPTSNEYAAMRKELLSTDDSNEDTTLRQRRKKISSQSNQTENLEVLLQEQRKAQDKITQNMLSLTKNLKEQTLLAGDIVRSDTEKLDSSKSLADSNFDKLKMESVKMEEQQQKTWKWWVLGLIVIVVLVVFVNMVMLMKVTRKST